MHVRRFNFGSSLAVLLATIATLSCVGCYGGKDVPNSGVDSERDAKPAVRVAMSKEAFIDFVANESLGRPGEGFVLFLKLPGRFSPEERTEKYADPIDQALQQAGLGRVINSAAMMGAKPFSSVSVEVSELAAGLEVVIETLRANDTPVGTEIRYGEGDDKKFLRFDSLK